MQPDRAPSRPSVADLAEQVEGRVIGPDDPDYDQARQLFYGGFDRRPAAIVRVAGANDVSTVVTLAAQSGTDLAVRSGAHSVAGHSVIDDGLVIDLSAMKAMDLDVDGHAAWAETGLTALEYSRQAAAHGLATGFGDTGSVGIGGITLGGGVGYFVRKYGLTIDDLLAADVVTADGRLVRADAEHESDLFWAIRGGGGNFGVATRFRYRLHEVPAAFGGFLFLPASPEAFAGFLAEAENAPDEFGSIVTMMPAPPMPFLPEEQHGKLLIMATMLFAGPPEQGEKVVAPFRALAEPVADLLRPMSYPEIYPPEQGEYHPTAASHTMFMDSFDVGLATAVVERLEASKGAFRAVQLRLLGGAMAEVPADATAFAHRSSRIMTNVAAFYEGPEDLPVQQAWVDEMAATLRQSDQGAYVGFLGDEGEDRVRAAYPGPTWDRLRAIKAQYDPDNLFRFNQNIPPAR
jgi:FAD/FMN-containing dehydrogenase